MPTGNALRIEIERAAGVEDARRGRTAGDEADLAMRDVDEAMSGSVEHQLEHPADIRGVGAVRNQEPFVGAEPQSRASFALARRTEPRRRLDAERHPAGDAHRLAPAQDEIAPPAAPPTT